MTHVQTKREIAELLASIGIRPRKRFGQHFLIDGNLMRNLAAMAQLSPQDLAIEVGGGTGGLTDLLVEQAGQVVCVEVDRDLQDLLADRFRGRTNFTLIAEDGLAGKHRLAPDLADAIVGYAGNGQVKLVANLPYQVATPLVMNLLVDYPQVRRLCFSVQAEVGERMVARAGSKAYGPLSVVGQCLADVEIVADLPASVFWPRPAVKSVMIRMQVHDGPFEDRSVVQGFAGFVRGVFDHRRKTLRKALGYVVEDALRDAVCSRFDGMRRPESFEIGEWVRMWSCVSG